MKPIIWAAVFLTFLAVPASAQQTSSQQQHTQQSKRTGPPDSPPRKAQSAVVAACRDLGVLGDAVDRLHERPALKDILDSMDRQFGTPPVQLSVNGSDSVWDRLIDCANQTHSESQRAEALRVAAMWEEWRADSFQKAYSDTLAKLPVAAPACKDLGKLDAEARAIAIPGSGDISSYRLPVSQDSFWQTFVSLNTCMEESKRLNASKPVPQFAQAEHDIGLLIGAQNVEHDNADAQEKAPSGTTQHLSSGDLQLLAGTNARTSGEAAPSHVAERVWRKALADPSSLVLVGTDQRLASEDIGRIVEHDRTLCDQIITVAGLTPNGLALYIPPEGQRFMAKNSKNYPRMCLVQDAANLAPGVPRYLLVWAYSDNAFAGFQPVQQVTTAPVSGSGTVTNLSGGMWHFTYNGTETEINTVEAPYVVQSRSLYLRAYDERGNLVSQHSITTSNMAGGDASYSAGYNAGALISALWNNPSHLIKSVLKDVQKDSIKDSRK